METAVALGPRELPTRTNPLAPTASTMSAASAPEAIAATGVEVDDRAAGPLSVLYLHGPSAHHHTHAAYVRNPSGSKWSLAAELNVKATPMVARRGLH